MQLSKEQEEKDAEKAKTYIVGLCRSKHPERDICNRCGAEYEDILGIGCCGKCFYGTPTNLNFPIIKQ